MNGISQTVKILTLIALAFGLLATLSGFSGFYATRVLGLETSAAHEADIDRIERKLDCALFRLPQGCEQKMSPR